LKKRIITLLTVVLALALYIGIPKLIPDEPYDLSEVPRFYAANGYFVYNNYSTGRSYGPVRAPSDAIDYAVNYRLISYNEEFDIDFETTQRGHHAYYDPDYDLWMVWDYPRFSPNNRTTICFPGASMDTSDFLTFIRGSDGMILGYLPGQNPPPVVFQPPQTPAA